MGVFILWPDQFLEMCRMPRIENQRDTVPWNTARKRGSDMNNKSLIAGVVVLVLLCLPVVLYFSLDAIVKRGIETAAPRYTGTDITLRKVSLSPLSGQGRLDGLVVRNPPGFQTPSAFELDTVSFALDTISLFSNVISIDNVRIVKPQITYELTEKKSNIEEIIEHVRSLSSSKRQQDGSPGGKAGEKHFSIREVVITDAMIRVSHAVLKGKTASLTVPEVRVRNIGTDTDGGVLVSQALYAVLNAVDKKVLGGISRSSRDIARDLEKNMKQLEKDLQPALRDALEKKKDEILPWLK